MKSSRVEKRLHIEYKDSGKRTVAKLDVVSTLANG